MTNIVHSILGGKKKMVIMNTILGIIVIWWLNYRFFAWIFRTVINLYKIKVLGLFLSLLVSIPFCFIVWDIQLLQTFSLFAVYFVLFISPYLLFASLCKRKNIAIRDPFGGEQGIKIVGVLYCFVLILFYPIFLSIALNYFHL